MTAETRSHSHLPSGENEPADDGTIEYDPVFVNSRREALWILGAWAACLLWSVPYCYLNGYSHRLDPSELTTVLGMPSWVFWGVLAPWMLANVFTVWLCFFYMTDDDLGEAEDEREIAPGDTGPARRSNHDGVDDPTGPEAGGREAGR